MQNNTCDKKCVQVKDQLNPDSLSLSFHLPKFPPLDNNRRFVARLFQITPYNRLIVSKSWATFSRTKYIHVSRDVLMAYRGRRDHRRCIPSYICRRLCRATECSGLKRYNLRCVLHTSWNGKQLYKCTCICRVTRVMLVLDFKLQLSNVFTIGVLAQNI